MPALPPFVLAGHVALAAHGRPVVGSGRAVGRLMSAKPEPW